MAVPLHVKNQHLLWRAGFGPMAEDLPSLDTTQPQSYYKALVKAASKMPYDIDVADNAIKGLFMGIEETGRQQKMQLSEDQKKMLRQRSREDVRSLNLAWLREMVNSKQQLREKMAFFWHGHFATRNLNILYQQQYLSILRKGALGNFAELLTAVSKSAGMINFLNNNQNRKGHPNENFAREVMELFTLGRGNYTETDVKEAARAFTGWGAELNGNFVFRKNLHDSGSKTIFGKTGNYTGDDVLSLLLERKQTAYFITAKLFRFLVAEELDAERISWLAERFYQSNYEISRLLEDIFTSDWFYEKKYIGQQIKSPILLLAGMQRMLPFELEQPETLLLMQRLLGQILFNPPNVAGWPGGKNWIDSSSLLLRMRLPRLFYGSDSLELRPKDDDDQQMGMAAKGAFRAGKNGIPVLNSKPDWGPYLKVFAKSQKDKLTAEMTGFLLQAPLSIPFTVFEQTGSFSSRETFIQSVTLEIMSTPEYQLC